MAGRRLVRQAPVADKRYEGVMRLMPVWFPGWLRQGADSYRTIEMPMYWHPESKAWLSIDTYYMRWAYDDEEFPILGGELNVVGLTQAITLAGLTGRWTIPAAGFLMWATFHHENNATSPNSGLLYTINHQDESRSTTHVDALQWPVPDDTYHYKGTYAFKPPYRVGANDEIQVKVTNDGGAGSGYIDYPVVDIAFKYTSERPNDHV